MTTWQIAGVLLILAVVAIWAGAEVAAWYVTRERNH